MAYLITSFSPSRTIAIDEVSSTVTYIGVAKPGTSTSTKRWQIRRVTVSGTVTLFEYADGNERFDNEWDERANLSYS